MEGAHVGMTSTGWPENDGASSPNDTITADECVLVWNSVMQDPPAAAAGLG